MSIKGHLIKAELKSLIEEKGCGHIIFCLSWHDAGVYSTVKLAGGCANAAVRFAGSGDGAFGANAGLPVAAVGLVKPVADKYASDGTISHADLWALAANVSIEAMSGPRVPTRFGRVDVPAPSEGIVESEAGRLPDGDKGVNHLREILHPKGFTDRDIVALSGGHAVGQFYANRSASEGKWTSDNLKFDNSCFKNMLEMEHAGETTGQGCPQKRDEGGSGTIKLISDLALLEAPFREFVELYAKNQETFFRDFAAAWVKVQGNGSEELRDSL